jgi:hypothetical protein
MWWHIVFKKSTNVLVTFTSQSSRSTEMSLSFYQNTWYHVPEHTVLSTMLWISKMSQRSSYVLNYCNYRYKQIHTDIQVHSCIHYWPGECSRYSDLLQDGWSGYQIQVGVRFSAPIQTSPGTNIWSRRYMHATVCVCVCVCVKFTNITVCCITLQGGSQVAHPWSRGNGQMNTRQLLYVHIT